MKDGDGLKFRISSNRERGKRCDMQTIDVTSRSVTIQKKRRRNFLKEKEIMQANNKRYNSKLYIKQ